MGGDFEMNRKKVRKSNVTLILIITAGVLITLCFVWLRVLKARTPVVKINDQNVLAEEWKGFLQEQKSATTVYFTQNYGCTDFGEEFWETKYDGITPHEYAVQRALDALITDAMVLQEASDRALIASIDLETIKEEWRRFNTDRQNTMEENGVIYGPAEYSFTNYYRHLISNLRNLIAEEIISEGSITEEELRQFYNKNHSLFSYMGEMQVQGLLVSADTEDAYEAILSAKEAIKSGMDFTDACTVYASSKEPTEFTFTSLSQKADLHGESEVLAACSSLDAGEVSEIVKTQQGYYLLQVIHKSEEQIYDFEEVQNRILDILAAEKVETCLQVQRDMCSVSVNEILLAKVKIG